MSRGPPHGTLQNDALAGRGTIRSTQNNTNIRFRDEAKQSTETVNFLRSVTRRPLPAHHLPPLPPPTSVSSFLSLLLTHSHSTFFTNGFLIKSFECPCLTPPPSAACAFAPTQVSLLSPLHPPLHPSSHLPTTASVSSFVFRMHLQHTVTHSPSRHRIRMSV